MAAAAPKLISREVFVHIVVDPKGPTPIRVDPDPFWVSKGANEEVVWHCTSTEPNNPNPDFEVKFDKGDGSPFNDFGFNKNDPCSGLVRRGVTPSLKIYKYTVTVVGVNQPLDPGGGVNP